MLDLIRKKQKSVLIKIVFWTIIAAFVGTIFLVWGKGSRGPAKGVALEVNGDSITFDDYRNAYENMRRFYQNVYRDSFNPEMEKQLELERQVVDQLINVNLLLQEADDLDIEVTKQEVVDAIAAVPEFMRDGRFDMDQYRRVLQYQRMTPKQFEQQQRRQMLLEKVRERIQQDAAVTPEEVTEEYRRRNEMVNLSFVRLTPSLFENKVVVTDPALQEFYQEHKEEFEVPEKASLRYVRFDPERYVESLEINDRDIEDYYRRHEADFDVPEQAKVSHILFRASPDADEGLKQKKRQLAEKVLGEIRARDGRNFAEMARKYSDDPGSAVEGGSLGFFTRGATAPAFEDVAFSLVPGEISDIVETSFGLHIIKGEGHIEPGVKPLAEVMPQVRKGLVEEKAREKAIDNAMQAYGKYRDGGDLDALAGEYGLKVAETGPFVRGESVPGIGKVPEANATAFRLEKGKLAKPLILPEGTFLYALQDRTSSTIPELAEVREAVEKAYRREQSPPLAEEAAEELLAGLKSGKSFQQLVKGKLYQVEETGFFPRSYGDFIPRIGSVPELAAEAFKLTRENPVADKVYPVVGQYLVVRLKDNRPADMSKLDQTMRQDLEKVLLTRKKDALLEDRLAALRKEADIRIDPTLERSLNK